MGQILENGYEVKTTFWSDFTIADAFGVDAIKDTYKNAFNSWKHHYEYVTELALVCNWKLFSYYEKDEDKYNLYLKLYQQTDEWCMNNLKGSELMYYIQWTD
jgi:hypothetical protein